MLTPEQLNQRYLSMRKDSHARIVAGFGSGSFAFRENIMRGYVHLRAASQGIDLARHRTRPACRNQKPRRKAGVQLPPGPPISLSTIFSENRYPLFGIML